MLGAGTVINPIVKIVTTVVILAAVGIFIVRPVLDTTDKAIDSAARQSREIQQNVQDNIQQSTNDANLSSARSRADSYASSLQSNWPAAARAVRACASKADDDVSAMEHCADIGHKLVFTVQSDRSLALSYADSLDAQGDQASATRIRACVKQAGFKPAAMNRCRNLADDLLFG